MEKYTYEYHWMITAMLETGGGFVRSLAVCFEKADHLNYQKLLEAFPDYVSEYAERGKSMKLSREMERQELKK